MLAELQAAKERLRSAPAPEEKSGIVKGEESELSPEEIIKTRATFFASGAQHWFPLVENYTFPTEFIPLDKIDCAGIGEGDTDVTDRLAAEVDKVLAARGWERAFVKLSTRSAKDAPHILEEGMKDVDMNADGETKVRQLSFGIQSRLCCANGKDALALLTSSNRVKEDCTYALESETDEEYKSFGFCLVVREWKQEIALEAEFRGIVWNGELYAVGQYFSPLFFPGLSATKEAAARDIIALHEELKPVLAGVYPFCILDFAWEGEGKVTLIELNPFDGVALGCFPASTGLFRWDDEKDRQIIKNGPFEIRTREAPQSEIALKLTLGHAWRDLLFPPRGAKERKVSATQDA